MALEVSGNVGPQGVAAGDGTVLRLRLGRTGDNIVTQLHSRYYEAMRVGKTFSAANQAAQVVSVALTTTYTGLALYNPVNSGRILVPIKIKYAVSVAPVAIATIGLIAGFAATGGVTAQTATLGVQSNQIGNSGRSVGIALSQATIVTPTWVYQLVDGFTAGALSAPTVAQDLEGTFGLLPGAFIAIGALTAITGLGSITWEEVDLPL